MLIDAVTIGVSFWAALAIRLGSWSPVTFMQTGGWVLLAVLPLAGLALFWLFGFYRVVTRSFGGSASMRLARATIALSLFLASVSYLDGSIFIPRSTPIVFGLLVFCLTLAFRFVIRDAYNHVLQQGIAIKPVLIYGAGASGTQLAASLDAAREFNPVGFIDDDKQKWNGLVLGRPVHGPADIDRLIARFGVEDVLLAVPSASRSRRKEIIRFLSDRAVRVQTIPSLNDLVAGSTGIDRLSEVGVEELLARDPVDPLDELFQTVRGQSVLVTGAGGSIGSELCRQVAAAGAKIVVLYEISELALYQIERELLAGTGAGTRDLTIVPVLGSVGNEILLGRVLKEHKVSVLFHAAAYKHVPLIEANLIEGVRNNVLGTDAVARAAMSAGVRRAVLISTDKAVRPTNVMGATKRLAERVFAAYQIRSLKTIFSMVRFGNVLGSSGSVIPLFNEQIAAGGPVTVTHSDITRYFMTIPEAAQLVIQASSMGTGGDLFLLDMGEPVRILDLARRMIRLSGAEVRDLENPDGDIEIKITGLRPGEKIFEELLVGGKSRPTRHPRIFRAIDMEGLDVAMETIIHDLRAGVERHDEESVLEVMRRTVEGFRPTEVSRIRIVAAV